MVAESFRREPEGMLEDFKERIELLERRLATQPSIPPIPPFWPVGIMWLWPGDSPPMADFMLAQGQSLLRVDYDALFDIIGTTYGAVDGTHFNLPDLRHRVPVGLGTDAEFNLLGETGGAKTHTLTIAEIPAHDHQQNYSLNGASGTTMGALTSSGGAAHTIAEQYTELAGGGGAHNNLQPYLVLNYIVKVL